MRLLTAARMWQAQIGWRLQLCGKVCVSLHSDNNETPSKKSKMDQDSAKAIIAIVCSNQKLGCVSQDGSLPEPTVGLTDVRRSTLKKNGKWSPRTHLELKFSKTADRFINIREQMWTSLGVFQGGHKHPRNPNGLTFEIRDPNHTLGAEDVNSTPHRALHTQTFSRVMSHTQTLWSDFPPFPLPQHVPFLLYPSHSVEPCDPRTGR